MSYTKLVEMPVNIQQVGIAGKYLARPRPILHLQTPVETRHEKALINAQIRMGKGGRKTIRKHKHKQRKTRRAHVRK